MVYTITPMVHGGRQRHWAESFVAHLIGGATGGALTVGVLASFVSVTGIIQGRVSLALAAVVIMVTLLVDARIVARRIPSVAFQVPRRWREQYSPRVTAFLYGVGLGMGLTTRVYFASTYAIFLLSALLLSFPEVLIVGAVFGLSRSAGVWMGGAGASESVLDSLLARRETYRSAVHVLNVAAVALVGIALLSMVGGG